MKRLLSHNDREYVKVLQLKDHVNSKMPNELKSGIKPIRYDERKPHPWLNLTTTVV